MERIFVCALLRPSIGDDEARASTLIREWAEHARACVPEITFYLMLAMHERYQRKYEEMLCDFGIHVVTVPDEFPYESAEPYMIAAAGAGQQFLDREILRRCCACPALMRTRMLARASELAQSRPLSSAVWFLGLEARDRGTPAQFNYLWARMQTSCLLCMLLPQPDAHDRRAVILDLPASDEGGPANTVIMEVGMIAQVDRAHAGMFRTIRAGAVNSFDWALSTLGIFGAYPILPSQMPVTTVWVGSNARASSTTRIGEDYSWFWAAHDDKNIRVEGLIPSVSDS